VCHFVCWESQEHRQGQHHQRGRLDCLVGVGWTQPSDLGHQKEFFCCPAGAPSVPEVDLMFPKRQFLLALLLSIGVLPRTIDSLTPSILLPPSCPPAVPLFCGSEGSDKTHENHDLEVVASFLGSETVLMGACAQGPCECMGPQNI